MLIENNLCVTPCTLCLCGEKKDRSEGLTTETQGHGVTQKVFNCTKRHLLFYYSYFLPVVLFIF